MTHVPAPSWPHCSLGADSADPARCRGIKAAGYDTCLAHLDPADRVAYLAALRPGTDLDLRGTLLSSPLLDDLLGALRDPDADDRPTFGTTRFDRAVFSGTAKFDRVIFRGDVRFTDAVFTGDAWFERADFLGSARFSRTRFEEDAQFGRACFHSAARFHETAFCRNTGFSRTAFDDDTLFAEAAFAGSADFGEARFGSGIRFTDAGFGGGTSFTRASFTADAGFRGAKFSSTATFEEASFAQVAGFGSAAFHGDTAFGEVTFRGVAAFGRARFRGMVGFDRTRFEAAADFTSVRCSGDASFIEAVFRDTPVLGPLTCTGRLDLGRAAFTGPITVQAGATEIICVATRFDGPATVRVRFARVDLSGAVLTHPVLVTSTRDTRLEPGEALLAFGREVTASVVSIRRVDAALLMLNDVDLGRCVFFGTHHLDQLRLSGEYDFAAPPLGLRWALPVPVRWTARQVLAEEHHWRSLRGWPAARRGWTPGPEHAPVPGPATLAVLYRQLRKAFEDGKDEPGATDFYYGEMEMRRHDRRRTRRAERGLLHTYWLLSGYGLRASRALAWLAVAMTITAFTLMLWGLPDAAPQQRLTGTQPAAGQPVTLTVDSPEPALSRPLADRISGARAEKALRVVLNSVVFRSSGQDLTTAGTYIEMTSRFLEPALLALAIIAVRGRVKR